MKIEKRTFIEEDKYDELVSFLDENSEKSLLERQVIDTYHAENDFRMIRTKDYLKLDLKMNLKDEENTVFVHKKYEDQLIRMFFNLGMSINLRRYRIRHKYLYHGFYITLDNNIKFGRIFRVSALYKEESEKEETENKVLELFEKLGIVDIGMEKFADLYRKYRMDWADLTKELSDKEFLNGE